MKTTLLFFLAAWCCSEALAHEAPRSFVDITLSGSAYRFTLTIDPHVTPQKSRLDTDGDGRLTREEVLAGAPSLRALTIERVTVRTDEGACVAKPADKASETFDATFDATDTFDDTLAMWRAEAVFVCPDAAENAVAVLGFLDALPRSHTIVVRVVNELGNVQNWLLHRDSPMVPRARERSLLDLLRIGAEHIVFGFDHVAFVIGLVLLLRRVNHLVWVLSAFTVAHSVTLLASVLGWLTLDTRWVEVTIAASIGVVALLGLWKKSVKPATACGLGFGFGLVHGLGFAGALFEVFNHGEWLEILLGFNVGVELGQLAIVVLVWPLAKRMRRWPVAITGLHILLLVASLVWIIQRV